MVEKPLEIYYKCLLKCNKTNEIERKSVQTVKSKENIFNKTIIISGICFIVKENKTKANKLSVATVCLYEADNKKFNNNNKVIHIGYNEKTKNNGF